jgi:hypothetical protein
MVDLATGNATLGEISGIWVGDPIVEKSKSLESLIKALERL